MKNYLNKKNIETTDFKLLHNCDDNIVYDKIEKDLLYFFNNISSDILNYKLNLKNICSNELYSLRNDNYYLKHIHDQNSIILCNSIYIKDNKCKSYYKYDYLDTSHLNNNSYCYNPYYRPFIPFLKYFHSYLLDHIYNRTIF